MTYLDWENNFALYRWQKQLVGIILKWKGFMAKHFTSYVKHKCERKLGKFFIPGVSL